MCEHIPPAIPLRGMSFDLCRPWFIDHRTFMFHVAHALLRERRPNNVTRQIFHSAFIFRQDSVAAENIKAGVPPCREHPHHFFGDLPLLQKHLEYFVPENGLKLFEFQGRSNAEHSLLAIETSVSQKNVAVRIESKKVAEGLHGNDSAG